MLVKGFRGLGAVVLAAVGLSCGESIPEDPVILEIGERAVSHSQFEAYIERAVDDQSPLTQGELKARLLEQFIEEQLLLMAAEEEGIRVAPQEVEALAQEVGSLGDGASDEEAGRRANERPGATVDLEGHIRVRKLMEEKVLNQVSVDESEIASFYEQNSTHYRKPEVVDVSQILLETEEEAIRIREELQADPKRFAELAREFSVGPQASRDGRMGTFRRGELPPDFEEVIFNLRKGKFSDIVKTDFGYHIFRVNDLQPARDLSLEDVTDAIRVELLRRKSDEAMSIYLDELKRKYPVKIHTDRLDFPYTDREARADGVPFQGDR
jgi:peptidyl-prolyl cis-trans isomerase C